MRRTEVQLMGRLESAFVRARMGERKIFRISGGGVAGADVYVGNQTPSVKPHPFDLPLLYTLVAPVVELGRPRVGVGGDPLGRFQLPVVFEK